MDIEGTMQFIINQQSQFVSDIHSLQEFHRELGVRLDKVADKLDKLTDIVAHHEDAHVVTAGMVSKLAGNLTGFAERQGWLFDAQKRTEVKLDKLVDKMDGFIEVMRRNLQGGDGGKRKKR